MWVHGTNFMCLWCCELNYEHNCVSVLLDCLNQFLVNQKSKKQSQTVFKNSPFCLFVFELVSGNKVARYRKIPVLENGERKCRLPSVEFPAKCANAISQQAVKEKSKLKGSSMFWHQKKNISIAADWAVVITPHQHRMIPALENGERKMLTSFSRFSCQVRKRSLSARRQRNIKV